MEGRQFGRRELRAHAAEFFDPDTVLAGNRTPDLDAERENTRAKRLGTLQLLVIVRIVRD